MNERDRTTLLGSHRRSIAFLWLCSAAFFTAVVTARGDGESAPATAAYEKIEAVAFGPGGQTLVAVDGAGTVRVWNIRTHAQVSVGTIPPRRGVGAVVDRVSFSPDRRMLAVQTDGAVTFWDVRRARPLLDLLPRRASGDADQALLSRDGHTLARFSGPTLTFWNLRSGTQEGRVITTESSAAAAFSRDGGTIASAGANTGKIEFWDVRSHTPEGAPIRTGSRTLLDIEFSPDGSALAVASRSQHGLDTLRFWNVRTRRQIGAPIHAKLGFEHISWSPDGRTIATEGADVRIWSAKTHAPVGPPLPGDSGSIAFSDDGRELATGSEFGIVQLLGIAGHRELGIYPNAFEDVAFSPDGKTLAGVSFGGAVHLWDMSSLSELTPVLPASMFGPESSASVAFSPDGQTLATAGADSGFPEPARLWDISSHTERGPPLPRPGGGALRIALSPDGDTLATAGGWYTDAIELWDVATHTGVIWSLVPKTRYLFKWAYTGTGDFFVAGMAFSPDGRTFAIAGSDLSTVEGITLYDVTTQKEIGYLAADGDYANIVFSPDGHMLAAAGIDGATLWDCATQKPLGGPFGGWVDDIAFSPDGQTLATAGEDGTIRFWDVATGAQLGPPLEDTGPVVSVAFSPDGRTVASAGYSGVRLWDVAGRAEVGAPLG
jgi:WD40 repeat protein